LIKKNDDRYTFRLRGVFEYFLANYLTFDTKFIDKIIDDDDLYLSFRNEFGLYAGFKRDDEDFLDKIYKKTQKIFENITEKYKNSEKSIDALLKEKLLELDEIKTFISKVTANFKDGLSFDKQDEIEQQMLQENGLNEHEQTEVSKKQIQKIDESIESLEKSLFILGRVYKNIDEIKSNKKVHEIFDYILESSCFWGFKIIDDIKLK